MKQLNVVLREAQRHDSELGGMASITVSYNPYDGEWLAKADWSSGISFVATNEDVDSAVTKLLSLLMERPHT